jgi:hypothetical protein
VVTVWGSFGASRSNLGYRANIVLLLPIIFGIRQLDDTAVAFWIDSALIDGPTARIQFSLQKIGLIVGVGDVDLIVNIDLELATENRCKIYIQVFLNCLSAATENAHAVCITLISITADIERLSRCRNGAGE